MDDNTKPVWQLTVGELIDILETKLDISSTTKTEIETNEKREYVYGLSGLARILGCSKNHASKLKRTGMFDEAIIQNGRKIIIDKEKALELFNDR